MSAPKLTHISRIPTKPKPPSHLSDASKRWFDDVVSEFLMEPTDIKVLVMAAEQFDRAEQARLTLAAEGAVYTDAKGILHPHPCIKIERDSMALAAKLVRDLQLDTPPPRAVGRPGAFSHTTPTPGRGLK